MAKINDSHKLLSTANNNFKEKEYWLKKLSGTLVKVGFPYDGIQSSPNERNLQSAKIVFNRELASALIRMSAQSDSRLHMILLAGLYALLHKYTGHEDIIIGSPIYRQENETGFINTILALRNHVPGNMTLKELILQVRQTVVEAMENYGYPLEQLPQLLGVDPGKDHFPFPETALLLENIQDKKHIHPLRPGVIFSVVRKDKQLEGVVQYDALLYQQDTIQRIGANFSHLLSAFTADPEVRMSHLHVLSEEEKQRILFTFNRGIRCHPDTRTIQQLFEMQVKKTPGNIAAVGNCTAHQKQNKVALTYAELNREANQLANLLKEKGVQGDTIVALLLEPSLEIIIGLLGVLKADGAYLPIDHQYPDERIKYILADSNAKILLTTGEKRAIINGEIINLQRKNSPPAWGGAKGRCVSKPVTSNLQPANSLAYIIYTSGTTGRPKGVMVEHKNLTAYLDAFTREFVIHETDIVIQQASYSFDAFVEEVYPALINGGKVLVPTRDEVMDFDLLTGCIVRCAVTVISCSPLMLQGLDSQEEVKTIRLFINGGDVLKQEYIRNLLDRGVVYNTYGPTETTVCATYYHCPQHRNNDAASSSIPIGKPITNYNVYIMDGFTNLLPIGAVGELCITGAGVTRGYLNRPELTRQKFLTQRPGGSFYKNRPLDPHKNFLLNTRQYPIYRTGDLARWLSDGNIEFLGRKDQQIKIRGYRIEPGEIEQQLRKYEGVKEALVIDREDHEGDKYLCAYIVSDLEPDTVRLRRYLTGRLPAYMIPSHFVRLEQFPLIPTGKIDRKALPGPTIGPRKMIYITGEQLSKMVISPVEKPKPAKTIDPDTVIGGEIVLPGEEREKILYSFNDTETEFPQDRMIHQLFEEQVAKTPENTALEFGVQELAYLQLNQKSNQLARILRNNGVKVGSIVGLIAERSLEMIIALYAILKAGGAFMPMDPDAPNERQLYMLKEGQVNVLLTSRDMVIPGYTGKTIDLDNASIYKENSANLPVCSTPGDLTHILYTSGTTGTPKGVMLENRSIVNLMKALGDMLDFRESDRVISLTPITFDVFSAEILLPLIKGSRVIMASQEVLLDYQTSSHMIAKEKITIYQTGPAVLRRIVADPDTGGCLKGLRYLITAGEPLLETLLEQLKRRTDAIIYNLYAPAETTLYSTAKDVSGDNGLSIGKPIANTRVFILDKNENPVPIGIPGEICIGGVGVARGYLAKPKLTKEKFITNPFVKGDRLYKTGDLGKWLPNGEIQFIGRMDHQVKIDGIRIEPGEIENCLLSHEDVKEAAVVKRTNEKEEDYLCACLISEKRLSESQLRLYLANKLPYFMVPGLFVQLEKMPLTPNRKVNRKLLSTMAMDISAGLTYSPPTNETEEKLVNIWGEVLGIEKEAISIEANFFELGGHSLKAVTIGAKIHKELDVKVPLVEIFKTPTVRGVAEYIRKTGQVRYTSIEAVEKREYYALSSAQNRLYILQQMDLDSIGYNMPQMLVLQKEPEIEKLIETFKALIRRHQSLRTSFCLVEGQPVQRIQEEVEFEIKYYNLTSFIIQHFVRPFDLSRAPLLRAGIAKTNDNHFLLMMDIHHIISDGISHGILIDNYIALSQGKKLPPLRLQYRDYARWQNSEKKTHTIKQQETFWLKEFEEKIPVLDLPTDYPRPAIQVFEGGVVGTALGKQETKALKRITLENEITLYMLLLTALNVLLFKLSGQGDITIGTPVAGRCHADLEQIIGMFVNTLVMKNHLDNRQTFKQFLQELKKRTLNAFDHQDYPFEELVEKIVENRDLSRNPLFDVMFIYQDGQDRPGEEAGAGSQESNRQQYQFKNRIAKFDMTLTAVVEKEGLFFMIEYCTKLFKEETIERYLDYFNRILNIIIQDPGIKLSRIDLTSEQEKHQLLFDFNDTMAHYPKDKTLRQLFEQQVERTAGHIAVVGNHGTQEKGPHPRAGKGDNETAIPLTYRELNNRAHRLACVLRQKGVQPDTIVALMVERSVEMIIGILGILKAGGAYLPIVPGFPPERIKYMLEDSRTHVMVTQNNLLNKFTGNPLSPEIIDISGIGLSPANESKLANINTPADLVYVIYTSGSTGKPKGVMIQHRPLVNFIKGITDIIEFLDTDIILSLTSISFDIFGLETLLPLTRGSRVIIGDETAQVDPVVANELIERRGVTIFQLTPSRLTLQLSDQQSARSLGLLKYLLVGGEEFPAPLLEKAREITRGKIYNLYGPTETTIWSTVKEVTAGKTSLNIGKPICNTMIYILSAAGAVQPMGVIGELCISGDGVARGYLNNPELTAEKFNQDLCDYQDYHDKNNQKFLRGGARCFTGAVFTKSAPPGRRRQKLYRTGDFARWLPDGNIQFLGRIDFQVKIRGYRIEPGELERLLSQHDRIKEVVVVARESTTQIPGQESGDKFLCAYYVPNAETPPVVSELREYLAKDLPDYMLPSHFVPLEKIPLTPSGKVDRKALPEPGPLTVTEDYTAPQDKIEIKLAEIWGDILGIDKNIIGINSTFFQLGGHSLKAVMLISRIHRELNVKLSLVEVFKSPTIKGLSRILRERDQDQYVTLEPAEKKEYYPLSSAQKRLYVLQQMDPESTSYNLPELIPLQGKPGVQKLEDTFNRLIARHESLRTSFLRVKGEPYQEIHKTVDFSIHCDDAAGTGVGEGGTPAAPDTWRDFVRPFDLTKPPLMGVTLITGPQDHYFLVVDMHHIISDAVSNDILRRDFMALHQENQLPGLKLHYKDFSEWQNGTRKKAREVMQQQEAYWQEQFQGELPILHLPLDHERPGTQTFAGQTIPFEINQEDATALKMLAEKEEVTIYMILLAIFNVFLAKLSGQEDIVVGTDMAGRNHADLENIIGMFVNTIAIRSFPESKKSFKHFLQEVKQKTLEIFENQDYPFEDLVNQVVKHRDISRNPLFDVMFAFREIDMETGENTAGEGTNQHREPELLLYENTTSKFDLLFSGVLRGNQLSFAVEYSTELFKEESIRVFIGYFKEILATAVRQKDTLLEDIKVSHGLLKANSTAVQIDFGF